MNNLKKVYLVIGCICLSLTLFSFKSANENEQNLVGTTISNNGIQSKSGFSNESARITAIWRASGKEVAKFVAYEVVLRGIDYMLGDSPIGRNNVLINDEIKSKLNNL